MRENSVYPYRKISIDGYLTLYWRIILEAINKKGKQFCFTKWGIDRYNTDLLLKSRFLKESIYVLDKKSDKAVNENLYRISNQYGLDINKDIEISYNGSSIKVNVSEEVSSSMYSANSVSMNSEILHFCDRCKNANMDILEDIIKRTVYQEFADFIYFCTYNSNYKSKRFIVIEKDKCYLGIMQRSLVEHEYAPTEEVYSKVLPDPYREYHEPGVYRFSAAKLENLSNLNQMIGLALALTDLLKEEFTTDYCALDGKVFLFYDNIPKKQEIVAPVTPEYRKW